MIVGHKKQINFLESVLQSKGVSQAYLFIGPESVGKFSIAKLFANALNKSLRSIEQKNIADENRNSNVDILEPEVIEKKGITKTKNIEIDSIRKSQKNLSLYPLSGKFRVLIINDAHSMSIASQNVLLKTLEEPNETSIIILITHKDGDILDTIKSRCQNINFNLVALDEIKKSIQKKTDERHLEKIVIFSMGRPGEANKMIKDSNELKEKDSFIKDLGELNSGSLIKKMNLAEKYSKNIPKTIDILEFWIWFLRIQIFRELKDDTKTKRYYEAVKKIDESLEKMKNPSLNGRLILENLFLGL